MLQVYVFKLSTLPEESMHEIRLAGMAYDGRDVYIIFVNARSLTGRLVVEHIYRNHYIPWMEGVRLAATNGHTAEMTTHQDSDPQQLDMLESLESLFEAKHVRVTHTP